MIIYHIRPYYIHFIYSINCFGRLVRARQLIFFALYNVELQKLKFLSFFQSDNVECVKNEEKLDKKKKKFLKILVFDP